jgi:hypothetical protein
LRNGQIWDVETIQTCQVEHWLLPGWKLYATFTQHCRDKEFYKCDMAVEAGLEAVAGGVWKCDSHAFILMGAQISHGQSLAKRLSERLFR